VQSGHLRNIGRPLAGPAGLASPRQVKDLNEGGTFGDPDVFQYLSQRNVSADSGPVGFEPLEHSVYEGSQRLGRYIRTSPKRYVAFDARGHSIGKFASKRAAFAAVGQKEDSARGGVR
jgi:hypothetical protein